MLRQTVTQIFFTTPFFVAMDGDNKTIIRLRCAVVLNRLLDKNKRQHAANITSGVSDLSLVHNLAQVSLSTGLRPATVSNIFNGDSAPSLTSLLQILDVLGSKLTGFAKEYDDASDSDIIQFKKDLSIKKQRELLKKGKP